ncbi:alpha/beta fold hydrolase [Ottowia thiooxydans]|uniref:3-oxoadipate enol-lactonase n=1 Tax=Ottowia thiooxydans TaxID=219182 RepID=A0ABV2Q849_9BURK
MSKLITIGDMQVQVEGKGPPLVFCHGFTTTGLFWREQVEPFARTHQVVVINLPGHGPSARPEGREYTIEAFAKDLSLVFDQLKLDDAVLVGLSMGGTVSQRFTLANEGRLKGLVLVGATPHGLGPDVQVANVLAAIDEYGVEEASQRVIERSFGPLTSKDLIEFAKREVIQTPEFVAKRAITSLNESDTRNELQKIQLPTLVVCGKEDRITPADQSRALAQGIPGAQLVLIDDAGHFPMLEAPEIFNRELRQFLSGLAH